MNTDHIEDVRGMVPVAWMHNLPGRVDVIHTEVKNLLARQAVESHQGFHRPLDKTEHYTIPLYDHAKPCERCKELEEQVHFQSCLTRDLLPYQDEAVKGRDKLAALEAEKEEIKQAIRWAPSSAHWSNVLIKLCGEDSRDGINALEKQLREAQATIAQHDYRHKGNDRFLSSNPSVGSCAGRSDLQTERSA